MDIKGCCIKHGAAKIINFYQDILNRQQPTIETSFLFTLNGHEEVKSIRATVVTVVGNYWEIYWPLHCHL